MMIKCDSIEDYNSMCEKIRYFEIDGKQCRALKFEKEIMHQAHDKKNQMEKSQVFVKNIPKHIK